MDELLAMGFPEERAGDALVRCSDDIEQAALYLVDNPDFDGVPFSEKYC
jgi:hypothetical protein